MHARAAVCAQQPLASHVRGLVQQVLRHASATPPHVQHAWGGGGPDEHRADEKGGVGCGGALCPQDLLHRCLPQFSSSTAADALTVIALSFNWLTVAAILLNTKWSLGCFACSSVLSLIGKPHMCLLNCVQQAAMHTDMPIWQKHPPVLKDAWGSG